MACIIYVTTECPLPGGEKMIRGFLNPDSSYAAGGEEANISNYLKGAGYPTVVCASLSGYVFDHDGGTASAGKIRAYQNVLNTTTVNGVAANTALYQVHTAADLSALNIPFIAVGPAF